MPQPEVRVGGSGFSVLYYDAHPIAWLQEFNDQGQSVAGGPSGRNYQSIYELGLTHPKEIVTGYVLGEGTITARIAETWNRQVWEHLAGLEGTNNILDVYERLRQRADRVTCQHVIRPPNNAPPRGKVYHGCVVTGIPDGENITIGTLSLTKDVTIMYTHTTPLTSAAGLPA